MCRENKKLPAVKQAALDISLVILGYPRLALVVKLEHNNQVRCKVFHGNIPPEW